MRATAAERLENGVLDEDAAVPDSRGSHDNTIVITGFHVCVIHFVFLQ